VALLALAVALSLEGTAPAAEAWPLKPAAAGKGRLVVLNGVPVLHLYGTPGDMGQQQGQLLAAAFRELMKSYLVPFAGDQLPVMRGVAPKFVPFMPPELLAELRAFAAAAGEAEDNVVLANTFLDLSRAARCSVVIATGEATGGTTLFARNLDFPVLNVAHKATLVTVHHSADRERHSFASVGWPGIVGVLSGMNDAGLCVATLVSFSEKGVQPGTPYTMMYRQALERCATADEVVRLVRATPRTCANNLAVADAKGGALVIEFTPKAVAVRQPEDGVVFATNHFRSLAPTPPTPPCERFEELRRRTRQAHGRIGLAELKAMLKAVQMTEPEYQSTTLQSMVFEPAARRLHLAIGHLPASEGAYVTLDCDRLLAEK
jgi:predicted choloylglycine hydrolase